MPTPPPRSILSLPPGAVRIPKVAPEAIALALGEVLLACQELSRRLPVLDAAWSSLLIDTVDASECQRRGTRPLAAFIRELQQILSPASAAPALGERGRTVPKHPVRKRHHLELRESECEQFEASMRQVSDLRAALVHSFIDRYELDSTRGRADAMEHLRICRAHVQRVEFQWQPWGGIAKTMGFVASTLDRVEGEGPNVPVVPVVLSLSNDDTTAAAQNGWVRVRDLSSGTASRTGSSPDVQDRLLRLKRCRLLRLEYVREPSRLDALWLGPGDDERR